MTAGRGIAHSERTPPEVRQQDSGMFGVQLWVALPKAHEETAPAFHHHDAAALPELEGEGVRLRVIAGSFGDYPLAGRHLQRDALRRCRDRRRRDPGFAGRA